MDMDPSGWMWFSIDVVFVLALGVAVAYGTMMWRERHRDPAIERLRDQATRDHYRAK